VRLRARRGSRPDRRTGARLRPRDRRRGLFQDQLAEDFIDAVDLFEARGAVQQSESVFADLEEAAHLDQVGVLAGVVDVQAGDVAAELFERPAAAFVVGGEPLFETLVWGLGEDPPAFDIGEC
jgi:hypothetical protein